MTKSSQRKPHLVSRLRSTPVLFMLSFLLVVGSLSHGFGVFAASCSSSTDCQQQIDSLNAQNAQAQSSISSLETKAGSYQAAIAALQTQIATLQSQIASNQAQQAQLQQEIAANQAQLVQQKAVLADDLKTTYLSGQLTPVEMLATSSNLSEYIDKQQTYVLVQDKIQDTLTTIDTLQKSLSTQNAQVTQLLASLNTQQSQVVAAQNQQTSLLAYNQSQQDSFNQQITSNKSALSQLYAQQAAIIAASFGGGFHYGGTGGYPYANAVCLNSDGDCGPDGGSPYGPYAWGYPPSNGYDGAGWAYRNCTSYAFWRLAQTTGVTLNANLFNAVYASGGRIKYSVLSYGSLQGDFYRLGYTIDKNPNGSAVLAVNTDGDFGHIMYVEGVDANGQAIVSQYNAGENGLYSTGTLTNLDGIYFIHIR
jgi:peptidoglycan hydrolase CwlO-like protein/surface antigen